MIYGYIRVSTDRQTLENQRFEISRFAYQQNFVIDGWIQETISGTKSADKRKLGKLLGKVKKNDLIVCAELSRLGRNMFMIMNILNTCLEKECRVWTIKEGYRLGEDIQSKVLAFAFGIAAEIERQLISTRTREALARKKAEGQRLGRQSGSRNRHYKLDAKASLIQKMLVEGASKQEIAKTCGVAKSTLIRWIRMRNDLI
ncbi:MAG: master DNA invertase Mpi family serine-type recombinase [Bacteroidales bacterium]|nr:master DNA invertase Mpi family serine-type recombinase [Bacteroidales bacterium]